MKIFDANVEVLAIKTACDSSKRAMMLSKVSEEFFGSDQAKEVYRRIMILLAAGKAIPSTDVLRNDDALSDSAKAFVCAVVPPLESEDDIDSTVTALNKYRKARIILQATQSAVENMQAQDPDVDQIVLSMETMLQKCHAGTNENEMKHYCRKDKEKHVQELAAELDAEDESIIPSGFAEYDKRSGGFRRKSVLVLASPPGGGKSAMAQQMMMNHYSMGYNVCLVSYEMDELEIKFRSLSAISAIDHNSISLKRLNKVAKAHILQKWEEFLEGSGSNNRMTIWTPGDRELSMPEIAMELKPYKYDVIYIDYIGLLRMDPKRAVHEMLGIHTRQAKLAANGLDALMVVLCQLDDEELKIKYSKAIKANAHTIWAWESGQKEKESGIVEIVQQKARGAEPFNFLLARDFRVMTFRDFVGVPPIDPKEKEEIAKKKPPPRMKGLN